MNTKITADALIDRLFKVSAERVWLMTKDQFAEARNIKDENGYYLWKPGDYNGRGTIAGLRVVFVDDIDQPDIAFIMPESARVMSEGDL